MALLGSRAVVDEHGRMSKMSSDSPKTTPHRATSQLPVEPPHGVRRRVVVDPEVHGDRGEPRATSAHLYRLSGDPLVHRGLGRIPQLKGEDVAEVNAKITAIALATMPLAETQQ